jgi:hypothetical protein
MTRFIRSAVASRFPRETSMNKQLTSLTLALVLAAALFLPARPAAVAQEAVTVTNQDVDYTFGDEITFQLSYQSELSVESITLILQAPGLPSFVGAVTTAGEGQGSFIYSLTERPLPVFSDISYTYQFTLSDGGTTSSPTYHFTYLDNRFNWQELIGDPFKIYWYEGEINLAQDVLDAALQGQTKTLDLLQQPPGGDPIVIFIYDSAEDLQSSLAFIGQTWVSGYADPARGSIVVALPAEISRPLEIQRLIPHEVAHILLYRFMGAEFSYLPAWLNEGIASQMEIYSLPEYDLALQRAHEGGDLIPLTHLCQAFPADEELALLAYAQSDSLVEYIRRTYGTQGLQSLIYAYDQGVSCERGVEISLGMTLDELEKDWRLEVFDRGTYQTLIYGLAGVLFVLVATLAGFIYYKTRKPPGEKDWDENELYS